jgi:hypothetical protein
MAGASRSTARRSAAVSLGRVIVSHHGLGGSSRLDGADDAMGTGGCRLADKGRRWLNDGGNTSIRASPRQWGRQQNRQDLPGAGRSYRSNLDERVSLNKKEKARRVGDEVEGVRGGSGDDRAGPVGVEARDAGDGKQEEMGRAEQSRAEQEARGDVMTIVEWQSG